MTGSNEITRPKSKGKQQIGKFAIKNLFKKIEKGEKTINTLDYQPNINIEPDVI